MTDRHPALGARGAPGIAGVICPTTPPVMPPVGCTAPALAALQNLAGTARGGWGPLQHRL